MRLKYRIRWWTKRPDGVPDDRSQSFVAANDSAAIARARDIWRDVIGQDKDAELPSMERFKAVKVSWPRRK